MYLNLYKKTTVMLFIDKEQKSLSNTPFDQDQI